MWPYGRGQVPHPAQNLRVYNPQTQNQQSTIYTTYAPYSPNPPYSQQEPIGYMTYTPYPQHSQQEMGYATYAPYPLYSQQELEARLSQVPMASDMVLQRDQNWLFQNRYRRASSTLRRTMPEYRNGEVVMVRCNQQKWLNGVIQRMSAQGVRIWITDANILVNVPLVLLPTHVVKMSMYSESMQTLPPAEPMWTITGNGGYRIVLVQCVRPAHLSHRQLFRVLDHSNVCAICKTSVSNTIDVVSPWNCRHQVHNLCLQLREQHSSTATCPPCNDNATRQLASTSNALSRPSNGRQQQQQQWLDLQCACGFKNAVVSVGIMDAPVFCPNCHQPVNVNPITMNMQSGQPSASMNFLRAHQGPEREIPPNSDSPEIPQDSDSSEIPERERFFSAQDFGFGWPTQSFSGPSTRLEAIDEGREGPPSPEQNMSLTDEGREEPCYLPSYLQALRETFENNTILGPNIVAERPIDVQPPSSSRSSWQDDLLYEPSRTRTTPIPNEQYSSFRSSLQDGLLGAPCPAPSTPIQNVGSSSRSSAAPALVTRVKLVEVEEAEESTKKLATGKTTVVAIEGQKLWKRASEPNTAIAVTEGQKLLTTVAATEGHKLWKRGNEPNTTIAVTEGQKLLKRASEPNTTIAVAEGHKALKRGTEPNTTIAVTEGQKLWKRPSEPNTAIAVTEGQKLLMRASEVNTTVAASEGHKLLLRASEPNTAITVAEGQKLEPKRASEPNTAIAVTEGQTILKRASEPNTTIAVSEGHKVLMIASEPNTTIAVAEGQTLWKRGSEPNTIIAVTEEQKLLMRESEVNWTSKLGNDEESEEIEEASSSNAFAASSSSAAPMYDVNHFAALAEGQKLWRRASEVAWTSKLGNIEESDEGASSNAPVYVNHFADFVKLAMAGSSTAKDIIASASAAAASPSTTIPPPLESAASSWASPPPAFFTQRPSASFTEDPAWVTLSKNPDEGPASPAWITVIKDGVDSRKPDDKRWELDRFGQG